MGWVKETIRTSEEIFNEIIKEGWSGRVGSSSSAYEYWSDRIKDNYDVTLLQCNEICLMVREYYNIKKFYATD